ncbi:MAG TPA: hypothetical protein VN203_26340 [Candidatus Acidoferrum sp.]|nr:hypothetical protein [Candidatus Acidoferrum sp.]
MREEGPIWTRIYLAMLVTLAAGGGSLAAVASAAESYDVTNCSSSTVTTLSARQELTVLSVDSKGIARSNPFDNMTYQCVSVLSLAGGQREGTGYCKYVDPDGDFFVGQQTFDSAGGTWKFLQGTGKWKGITGSGKFVPLTSGKPIVPGTAQGCVKATGTYELSK